MTKPPSGKPPFTPVNDLTRITPGVSAEIKIAIADALMAFSGMEANAEIVIWAAAGLSYEAGRRLTRMDARAKFDRVREFYELYEIAKNNPLPGAFWESIKLLCEARNAIAHGVWVTVDGSVPLASSFKASKQQPLETIGGEAFPLARLQAIQRQCTRIARRFAQDEGRLQAQRERPPQE